MLTHTKKPLFLTEVEGIKMFPIPTQALLLLDHLDSSCYLLLPAALSVAFILSYLKVDAIIFNEAR